MPVKPVKVPYIFIDRPKPKKSFAEFIKEHGLSISVVEVERYGEFRADLEPFVEERVGTSLLKTACGWGPSPDDAVRNLALGIRGSTLKVNNKTYIECPSDWSEI